MAKRGILSRYNSFVSIQGVAWHLLQFDVEGSTLGRCPMAARCAASLYQPHSWVFLARNQSFSFSARSMRSIMAGTLLSIQQIHSVVGHSPYRNGGQCGNLLCLVAVDSIR